MIAKTYRMHTPSRDAHGASSATGLLCSPVEECCVSGKLPPWTITPPPPGKKHPQKIITTSPLPPPPRTVTPPPPPPGQLPPQGQLPLRENYSPEDNCPLGQMWRSDTLGGGVKATIPCMDPHSFKNLHIICLSTTHFPYLWFMQHLAAAVFMKLFLVPTLTNYSKFDFAQYFHKLVFSAFIKTNLLSGVDFPFNNQGVIFRGGGGGGGGGGRQLSVGGSCLWE